MRIGIVGAGLGGLLAGALLSKNHEVVIFEKLPFKESQVGKLWELVARHKGVEPEDLSPREFIDEMT